MEALHQMGEIIADRYRIAGTLGRGGIGTTYEAEELGTGKRVALKELSLRRITDWKVLELFEREARVLSGLKHPQIPAYLDYFQIDTPQDRCFYLVQEIARGKSLSALVGAGWRAREAQVRQLAIQILQILSYLHSLTPPVIHRDIKPQNIICRKDGKVFLVDFGAVADTCRHAESAGSTVVGTYGYMAPEQFRGEALPATDLYGLGATLLFVLTQKSPADLPQRRLKIDFRSCADISDDFAGWLETALEPAVEDRFASTQQALAVLRGERESLRPPAPARRPPFGSRVVLQKTGSSLVVEIPPAGLRLDSFCLALLALIWSAFTFFWTVAVLDSVTPFLSLFSIPFWALWASMLGRSLFSTAGRTQLEIDRHSFRLQWALLCFRRRIEGRTEDIERVELNTAITVYGMRLGVCTLVQGVRNRHFGSVLTPVEKEWLVAELADFMGKTLPK